MKTTALLRAWKYNVGINDLIIRLGSYQKESEDMARKLLIIYGYCNWQVNI